MIKTILFAVATLLVVQTSAVDIETVGAIEVGTEDNGGKSGKIDVAAINAEYAAKNAKSGKIDVDAINAHTKDGKVDMAGLNAATKSGKSNGRKADDDVKVMPPIKVTMLPPVEF